MKRSDKAFFAIAIVAVLAVGGFVALLGISTQRRNAARTQLTVPESLAFHQELVENSVSRAPGTAKVDPAVEPQDARARIAAFDALFAETAFTNNDPEWGDLFRHLDRHASWTDEEWQLMRTLVEAIAPYLDRIRALGLEEGPVHALDFSKGHAMELPHLAPMRHLARLLAADAIVASRDGDTARVIENVEAMFGLGNALRGEPVLISQLVRIAVGSIGFNTLRLLPESGLDPEHYGRIADMLAGSDHREAFISSFAGEAAMVEVFFHHPDRAVGLGNSGDVLENGLIRLYSSPLAAPVRYSDEAAALEILQNIQEVGQLPLYEARAELDRIDARVNNLPWFQPVSASLLPSLSRALEAQARHEATLDIAELGLAVEQFRDATGSLPASLEEVAGYVGGTVPLDPFTGAPYIFRVTENGFLLYSVGRDLDDDGGVHDPNRADIAWRGVEPERQ